VQKRKDINAKLQEAKDADSAADTSRLETERTNVQYAITNAMRHEVEQDLKARRLAYFSERRVSGPVQEDTVNINPPQASNDPLKPLLELLRLPVTETWPNIKAILDSFAPYVQTSKPSSSSSQQVDNEMVVEDGDTIMEGEMDAQQDKVADGWNTGEPANAADWEEGEWDQLSLYV